MEVFIRNSYNKKFKADKPVKLPAVQPIVMQTPALGRLVFYINKRK